MSNLGAYQWMTTASKKVGGPINFLLLVATTGATIYKGGEIVVRKCIRTIKSHKKANIAIESKDNLYKVNIACKSNAGLEFEIGEQFRILVADGDSMLIEKIGDRNNPYFVPVKLLREISDYTE